MNEVEPEAKVGLAGRLLNAVEWAGNKLPDPVTLFVIGALLVPVVSHIVYVSGWEVALVEPATVDGESVLQETGEVITAVPMLTWDNLYGLVKGLKDNFINFPPLGVVLVGMLGIGVAERSGLIGAALKALMLVVPTRLLTPAMVFVGVMSSAGMDAGYVVLPPVAALLYLSVGRSPLAGIAAVFAGVSAGFCANLVITGLDPMLSELSQSAARLVDSDYAVAATCNWAFAAVSTGFLTFIGWAVTAWFVEPRLNARSAEHGGPGDLDTLHHHEQTLDPSEKKGLIWAALTLVVFSGLLIILIATTGSLLNGRDATTPIGWMTGIGSLAATPGVLVHFGDADGQGFDRWVVAIVPIIFFVFLVPALAYGIGAKTIKNDKDAARMMTEAMAAMAPIIVLAFFAGQFIAWFGQSNLGTMFAITGGRAIAEAGLPTWAVLIAFILLVAVLNLFIGSMSAKYTLLAPVFIPMFMIGASMSPELTQAAYRVGDSCTNIITPLNAYLIIILVFVQKYDKQAGMGTMIALMLPYSVVFLITWTALLLGWVSFGFDLGPNGPLEYVPATGN
ncbi:MAG: AbgT family transporter [Planctomycetota bacterium]